MENFFKTCHKIQFCDFFFIKKKFKLINYNFANLKMKIRNKNIKKILTEHNSTRHGKFLYIFSL